MTFKKMISKSLDIKEKEYDKITKNLKRGLLGIFAGITIFSSLYTIPTDSVGVIKTLGRYSSTTNPGLHFKIPYGIQEVNKIPVRSILKEEFGFRTIEAGVKSEYLGLGELEGGYVGPKLEILIKEIKNEGINVDPNENLNEVARKFLRSEYLQLTGDLNMADLEWVVQYKISDPVAYSFNVRNQPKTLRDLNNAVIKQMCGDRSVDEVITIGRADIETEAKNKLQELLDKYQTGIDVVAIKLQSGNPPLNVKPSFDKVNTSMQEKEKRINEAMKEYNEEIPKAGGEAKKIIEVANGYATERINMAEGDADRFLKVYEEYRKAPDITRRRLYIESMTKILKKTGEKWIIDEDGGELLLKKLDLGGVSNK